MAVQVNGPAPYAPVASITTVIDKHRAGMLPVPVTQQSLERVGVSKSLAPRCVQALKLLDFIGDDGQPTPEFNDLRRAATPDFKPRVAEMIRAAYQDVFAVVDPTQASYQQVHDAFRTSGFNPVGQINRMVSLFLGLLEYAGWTDVPKAAPTTATTGRPASPTRPKPQTRTPEGGKPNGTASNPLPFVPEVAGERVDVSFGDAGSVAVFVNVKWLALSDDTFTKLRKLIQDLKMLAPSDASPALESELSPGVLR